MWIGLVKLLVVGVDVVVVVTRPRYCNYRVALSLAVERVFLLLINLWLESAILQLAPLLGFLVVPQLHIFVFGELVKLLIDGHIRLDIVSGRLLCVHSWRVLRLVVLDDLRLERAVLQLRLRLLLF